MGNVPGGHSIPACQRRRRSILSVFEHAKHTSRRENAHDLIVEFERSETGGSELAAVGELHRNRDVAHLESESTQPGDLHSRQLPGRTIWAYCCGSVLNDGQYESAPAI